MMLFSRVLTACILLPLIALLIYQLPLLYFFGVVMLLMMWCAWEWSGFVSSGTALFKASSSRDVVCGIQKFIHWISRTCHIPSGIIRFLNKQTLFFNHKLRAEVNRALYVVFFTAVLFLSFLSNSLLILMIALCVWIWMGIAILFYQYHRPMIGFQYAWVRAMTGFIVLIACWHAIVAIYLVLQPSGLLFVLFIIFAADIGAYFSGRFFGKHALASVVSPKKTWEGFIGGMLCSLTVAAIGFSFFNLPLRQYVMMLELSFLTAFFSIIGDLSVSLMKRIVGIKDSGRGLPGHGGILDRMDSVASAVTLFASGILLLRL